MTTEKFTSIEQYLSNFTGEIRERLEAIRAAIREAAPEAQEVISYNMPALKQGGILVYFAAFKNHIGFFPTASGVAAFADELTEYKLTKGTIQLPNNKPIPFDLLKRITKFRVEEVKAKKKK